MGASLSVSTAAFDNDLYVEREAAAIMERLGRTDGRLYLEVGGHLLHDGHASRVLPGFDPACKVRMMRSLPEDIELLLCVNAADIGRGRTWTEGETYAETALREVRELEAAGLPRPTAVFTMWRGEGQDGAKELREALRAAGVRTFVRRWIEGYPDRMDHVVSPDGFGRDDHVTTERRVVIVAGLGSCSGKMSTCLGQVYLDRERDGRSSAYAKLELFPVWNLPLGHPTALAYAAATADISDRVMLDTHHREAYGLDAVNYNRDIEAFPLLREMILRVAPADSFMREYRSPTDMGVNMAGFAIVNDEACCAASVAEIESRIGRYRSQVEKNAAAADWAAACESLLEEAKRYKAVPGGKPPVLLPGREAGAHGGGGDAAA